jgi:hypothetical protein
MITYYVIHDAAGEVCAFGYCEKLAIPARTASLAAATTLLEIAADEWQALRGNPKSIRIVGGKVVTNA